MTHNSLEDPTVFDGSKDTAKKLLKLLDRRYKLELSKHAGSKNYYYRCNASTGATLCEAVRNEYNREFTKTEPVEVKADEITVNGVRYKKVDTYDA